MPVGSDGPRAIFFALQNPFYFLPLPTGSIRLGERGGVLVRAGAERESARQTRRRRFRRRPQRRGRLQR